jgi:hypothetical protein
MTTIRVAQTTVLLAGFALAVDRRAADKVCRLAPKPIQRAPKVGGSRLVSDVADHTRDLAALDLPKRLAAELKIIPLLVDRPTAVAHYQDAIVDAAHEVVLCNVVLGGR